MFIIHMMKVKFCVFNPAVINKLNFRGFPLPVWQVMILIYNVAGIQWIPSCHKNRMITPVITFWRVDVTSMTTSVSTMRFLLEIMII